MFLLFLQLARPPRLVRDKMCAPLDRNTAADDKNSLGEMGILLANGGQCVALSIYLKIASNNRFDVCKCDNLKQYVVLTEQMKSVKSICG